MKINIVVVGKLKPNLKKIFNNYIKKINFYAKIHIIEIKEVINKNILIQIKKETTMILKALPSKSKIILCSLQGNEYSSLSFSNLFEIDNITFVIGGSNGVDESKFNNKLKVSNMTFPHQLFRIMLIEQIYRAFSIKNGSKYHK